MQLLYGKLTQSSDRWKSSLQRTIKSASPHKSALGHVVKEAGRTDGQDGLTTDPRGQLPQYIQAGDINTPERNPGVCFSNMKGLHG